MRTFTVALAFYLSGCASHRFVLSDWSAMKQVMSTRHVAELQRRNPTRFTCWIEGSEGDARQVYLGENHPDHTVRVGAYRVTSDGRVWVNSDPTLLEENWVVVD